MKEEIICTICKKPMKETEWTWAEEDAHKECVLSTATGICSNDCGWFDMLEEGDVVQFDARVKEYIKGYNGYREEVQWERPIEQDYKLNNPSKLKVIH